MKFPFGAPAKSYAGAAAESPFQRAGQEWDRRMGAAVVSAKAWRIQALAAYALAGLMALGLIFVALQQRTFLRVVEVSPEGQVMSVRVADDNATLDKRVIVYHLGEFVRRVRSLPTDGVVLRENWLAAYKFLTPQAAAQLNEMARQDDPFLSLGRVGRTVQIRTIIQRSDAAWEVTWVETATNATGTAGGQAYSGVFTLERRTPRTADEAASNPLGLYINDFSWSRVR